MKSQNLNAKAPFGSPKMGERRNGRKELILRSFIFANFALSLQTLR